MEQLRETTDFSALNTTGVCEALFSATQIVREVQRQLDARPNIANNDLYQGVITDASMVHARWTLDANATATRQEQALEYLRQKRINPRLTQSAFCKDNPTVALRTLQRALKDHREQG